MIEALRKKNAGLKIGGYFTFECYDKNGKLKWKARAKNGVTNVGLNHILDTEFGGGSQVNPWFIGLIRDDSFTALAASDTMASHAGWQEADEYSETTRQEWTEGAAASRSMTNAVAATFSITDTEVMKGAFLNSDNTKSGSTGTLFCTALFSEGNRSVVNGDSLKVTYTLNAQDNT